MLVNRLGEQSSGLYVTLDGNITPQPVFLEINQHWTRIDFEHEREEEYRPAIRLKRILRIYLPMVPTEKKANEILDTYHKQMQIINDSHEVIYDRSIGDYVGVMTREAESAFEEIAKVISQVDMYRPEEVVYVFNRDK